MGAGAAVVLNGGGEGEKAEEAEGEEAEGEEEEEEEEEVEETVAAFLLSSFS